MKYSKKLNYPKKHRESGAFWLQNKHLSVAQTNDIHLAVGVDVHDDPRNMGIIAVDLYVIF